MPTVTLSNGTVITTGTPIATTKAYGTTSQQGAIRFGPWLFGTNRYFVINDEGAQSGNNTFFINKITSGGVQTVFGDGGVTAPWQVGQIFNVTKNGTFLDIITNDLDHSPGNYWLHRFDTSSDTMSHIDTGIAIDATVESGANLTNTLSGLTARANGNLIFAFPGAPETIGGHPYSRIYWAESNAAGTVWSAPALIAGQAGNSRSYGCFSITLNSNSGLLRFWWLSVNSYVGGLTPTTFWLHQISNDGSFHTLQTVSTDLNANIQNWFVYGSPGLPLDYVDSNGSSRLVVPYIGGNTTSGPPASGIYSPGPALSNWVAIADGSTVDPTWTLVEFDSTTQIWGNQLSMESLITPMYASGVLMLFWSSITSFDTVYGAKAGNFYWAFSLDNGATWTAAAVMLTYSAPNVPSGIIPSDNAQSLVLYITNNPGPSVFNFSTQHYFMDITVTPTATGLTGPGTGYVFEIEKGVGRLATWQE